MRAPSIRFLLTVLLLCGLATAALNAARSSNGTIGWNLQNATLGTGFPGANPAGPWTVAFWFKAANLSQSSSVITDFIQDNTGARWIIFFESTDDKISMFHNIASIPTGNEITVPNTAWHHYAYRKDAGGSSNFDYFIDGTKTSISTAASFNLFTDAGSNLGVRFFESWSNANQVNGDIAEYGLWTSSLSDANIANMAAGSLDGSTLTTGMLHYWPLCGTASPETDLGSANKTLTVNNVTQTAHPSGISSTCGGGGGGGGTPKGMMMHFGKLLFPSFWHI